MQHEVRLHPLLHGARAILHHVGLQLPGLLDRPEVLPRERVHARAQSHHVPGAQEEFTLVISSAPDPLNTF